MKSEVDIRNATKGLPKKTLDELYEEGFIRILTSGQRSQSCAIQVFSLLLCTKKLCPPKLSSRHYQEHVRTKKSQ